MNRLILSCILTFSILGAGCAGNTITVKGQQFKYWKSPKKGYMGDYEGLVDGQAYTNKYYGWSSVWLDPDVRFSNYSKLTIIDIEDWTKGEPLGYISDVSETISQALAMSSSLTIIFKEVSRSTREDTKDGLIIKGAVTEYQVKHVTGMTGFKQGKIINAQIRGDYLQAASLNAEASQNTGQINVDVTTELLLVDAADDKVIGKIVKSGFNNSGDLRAATENISKFVGILINSYWNESPGFDPKELIKEKTAGRSK
ncbi:MAG: hypothetical protein M0R70_04750 [Nitrospirae bacterium]|nr:hypothetical protein [Nitrospirota bacterium]